MLFYSSWVWHYMSIIMDESVMENIQLFQETLLDESIKLMQQDQMVARVLTGILHISEEWSYKSKFLHVKYRNEHIRFLLITPFFWSFSLHLSHFSLKLLLKFTKSTEKKEEMIQFAVLLYLIKYSACIAALSFYHDVWGCLVHFYDLFWQWFSKQLYTTVPSVLRR